ncbi:NADPH oxidase organizer 1-like [Bombina bombina]|uniref:NADPH oxidase organizer 1-like n=1 Tax=Bombina bombina TaxID=8345 RepID=UPI00235B2DBF|nr:NADPH oxidase organizer 1-like [Bombina bombina]
MIQGFMSEQSRHPLEAKAVGVMQYGRNKINMFSVLWTDQNEILIYRTFDDFKKLHRQLRKKYPLEAGLFKKSDSIIPKLRDVPLFRKNRFLNRFIERLLLLQKYSQDLLKTDGRISQSELVVKFFMPTNKDMNPSFPDNCLVIVPSDSKEKSEHQKQLPKPPTTHPIVSEQYVCIEDYETIDTKNRPFKVKRNETVGVLIKENTGWWLVENEDKCLAWFPAPYLKDLTSKEDSDSGLESDDDAIHYYAYKAYQAGSSDELSISIGVLVQVIEKSKNGWWLVRYNNKVGYVPSMFLKPYCNYKNLQTMLNQSKIASTPNLFTATSAMGIDTLPPGLRFHEEPSMVNDSENKSKINRMRSRSLSEIPSSRSSQLAHELDSLAKQNELDKPSSEWKPQPYERKTSRGSVEADELPSWHMKTIAPPFPKAMASDLDKEQNIYDICIKPQPMPSPPQIPERPRTHEILHKCTTVTKNALKAQGDIPAGDQSTDCIKGH